MNWTALTIICIWFSSALVAHRTKDSTCLLEPLIATILLGFGYLLLHAK